MRSANSVAIFTRSLSGRGPSDPVQKVIPFESEGTASKIVRQSSALLTTRGRPNKENGEKWWKDFETFLIQYVHFYDLLRSFSHGGQGKGIAPPFALHDVLHGMWFMWALNPLNLI